MVERITGFSGFDVETTIAKLMQAKRVPLDKLKQNKQIIEWQRDDYRTLNSKILDLRNNSFDMKLQTPYLTKSASSSNESVAVVKGTSNATEGTYAFKVLALADYASVTTADPGLTLPDKGLATAMSTLGLASDTTVTIGGEKGTATIAVKSTDTIAAFVSNFNGQAGKTGVKLTYEESMNRFFVSSLNTGTTAKIDLKSANATFLSGIMGFTGTGTANGATTTSIYGYTEGAGSKINPNLTEEQKFNITYNGKTSEFKINSSTTLDQLINSINTSDVGLKGVSAYLNSSNQLVLVNPDQAASALTLADSDSNGYSIVADLGFTNNGVPVAEQAASFQKIGGIGKDAKIKFNGVTADYHSNTMTLAGIQFTAKKVQNADDTVDPPITVSVNTDVDAVFNSIKSYIDKYNDTLDSINKELGEDRDRSFLPLTDDQRKAMKDDEIKSWEEKAKSGWLRNDQLLKSSLSNFRFGVVSPVVGLPPGDLNQLAEIGIGTLSYKDQGKLTINEAKLRQAISDSPEQVMHLFTSHGDDSSDAGQGLAVRLYNLADSAWKTIKDKAGTSGSVSTDFTIGKDLNRMNKRIDDMNNKMKQEEDRLYRQFSAMESAMSKFNAQSSYFSQIGQ